MQIETLHFDIYGLVLQWVVVLLKSDNRTLLTTDITCLFLPGLRVGEMRRSYCLITGSTGGLLEITSYSHQKTNEKVLELLVSEELRGKKILDIGAGEGFFCRLVGNHIKEQLGLQPKEILNACDLHPENFKYQEINCDRIDANGGLPYRDHSFDVVVCIEVIEHIEDQFKLAQELYRITKTGGRVILTTPNILNINSRLKFFYSGFWLLYDPLSIRSKDPIHRSGGHIHPITSYYLSYLFLRAGFSSVRLHFDRKKRSAKLLSILFYLPIKLAFAFYHRRLKKKMPLIFEDNREMLKNINSKDMLLSRTIIIEATS